MARAQYPLNRGLVRFATRKPVFAYPSQSRGAGRAWQPGTVLVEVVVDREGRVVRGCVLKAEAQVDDYFVNASYRAALGWRFKENFGSNQVPKNEFNRTIITFKVL
jgi:hypothetical protein